ncbi:cilia- and flagella-associated protein 251-like isoform X3 [Corythoichthys intestinalis]|uniref:cilia- and flagella-associated protein 251-like isoform X3 n=1 Tax=Corythoichthys intestinalis TaxID=161448 RepID=UPI0025A555FF|nr:cilia- and flagella-associated protein 251-like isoform X3 [Corythoichthys intestinalis]
MSDVGEAHRPGCQESARTEEEEEEKEEESLHVKKLVEESVHVKEEQKDYFIRVENPHIEEQQQPHPLKNEDPPYVKMEVMDIPMWTGEPLKGKDGGLSEASRGAEPSSASSSSSKEGFQTDKLFARPSESDDNTSHSLFYISQAHRPERQESARIEEEEEPLHVKKVEEESFHIKEEQKEYFIGVENPHIEEQQQPHPLKTEEEDPHYVKVEVEDIPKRNGEPLKGEDGGPSEASRGVAPTSGISSSSKEGFGADNLIARPSLSDDLTSLSLFCVAVNRHVITLPRVCLCRQEIPDVKAKLEEAEALTGA